VTETQGLLIVYTGDGKGKTTAALGLVLRAWGHGMRVCVVQFIKSARGRWGEVKAARKLGITWHTMGTGFVWEPGEDDQARQRAVETWELAKRVITEDDCELVILDEFTYPLQYGWIDTGEVVEWLQQERPSRLHVVITGRGATEGLIEAADLVTEMTSVKHPFDRGIPAQKGIEL